MTGRITQAAMAGGLGAVWRAIWPGVSLALAVLVASAPGRLSAFPIAALVPVMVIFHWVVTTARGLPFVLIFLAGLGLDTMSYGPMGAWALIYVAVALLAATVAEFANAGLVHRTAMLAACLGLAGLGQVALLLAFGVELPAPGQVGVAIALALTGYPVLAAALRAVTAHAGEPQVFERAGPA